MKRFVLIAVGVVVLLVGGIVAYGFATLSRAQGGLPQWDGEVELQGLGAEVRVRRGETGAPFIEAATEADLFFAQGFVHAQDRFWQMAITRRSTLGRLSEWFGSVTLPSDRIARMFGWAEMARRSFEALPDGDRALMEAYASGVNAWLTGPAYRRPPEMVVLHIDPEPWRAEDAFLVVYAMHRTLANAGTEFDRTALALSGADPEAMEILVGTAGIWHSKDVVRALARLLPTVSA